MKPFITLFFVLLFSLHSHAQRGGGRQNPERVHAAKIGYITERVKLTDRQAEQFWPVYNRYEKELREARRQAFQRARSQRDAAVESEADALRAIDSRLEAQEEAIEVQRKYKTEFLRIISAEQLLALYDAEREFNRMVVQRLRQQRGQRGGR